jgi:hypothetical protein
MEAGADCTDLQPDPEWREEMVAVITVILQYNEELQDLVPPRSLYEVQAEVDLMADHERIGMGHVMEWLNNPGSDSELWTRALEEFEVAERHEARAVALLEALGY